MLLQVGGAEVYKAEKYTTLYLLVTILDPDGKLVAKCMQPGMDTKKLEVRSCSRLWSAQPQPLGVQSAQHSTQPALTHSLDRIASL